MNDTPPPSSRFPLAACAGLCLVVVAAASVAGWWYFGRRQEAPPVRPNLAPPRTVERLPVPAVRFTDITEQAGIRFRHTNGSFGKKLLPETMGSGAAFLDYDGDGRQDLLLVNSCPWPGHEAEARSPGEAPPTQALYRNLGGGKFEDVTEKVQLNVTLYGMGATVGDYDNDGRPDVFLSGVGGNRLFRNVEGKHFEDVTAKAGVGGPGGWPASPGDFLKRQEPLNFSSSAAWVDYDGDARLDLVVCNYVTWSPHYDLSQPFTLLGQDRAFGPPKNFGGTHCLLYRNRGDGTFEDVSSQSGIQVNEPNLNRPAAKALGVTACDLNGDGYPEIVIANDTVRNFLFLNVPDPDGGRRFRECGSEAGVALVEGTERGAMGIDWGEYRPGKHALLIANFANEPCTFLRLEGKRGGDAAPLPLFRDVAQAEGIYGPSRLPLKFGAFFIDYDLDGRLDLLTANGHLEPDIGKLGQNYEQPAQLFWNTGAEPPKRGFEEVRPEQAGPDLFRPLVGRGSAYADIDDDGDLDVVLTSNGGPALLLRNDGGSGHHWLRLVLEGDGRRSNRSAIGARVEVEAGGKTYRREVISARGYLSQSELALTFGLGKTDRIDRVTIHWPGREAGKPQVLTGLKADATHVIRQGQAVAAAGQR